MIVKDNSNVEEYIKSIINPIVASYDKKASLMKSLRNYIATLTLAFFIAFVFFLVCPNDLYLIPLVLCGFFVLMSTLSFIADITHIKNKQNAIDEYSKNLYDFIKMKRVFLIDDYPNYNKMLDLENKINLYESLINSGIENKDIKDIEYIGNYIIVFSYADSNGNICEMDFRGLELIQNTKIKEPEIIINENLDICVKIPYRRKQHEQ